VLKPPQRLGRGVTGFDYFERHDTPRLFLLGLIHGAHAAFTQQANHPVPADRSRARMAHRRSSVRGSGHRHNFGRHFHGRRFQKTVACLGLCQQRLHFQY
jgi:hypothetical protein